MRKTQKIDGFTVEAIPAISGDQVEWTTWLSDLPYVRVTSSDLADARRKLELRWQQVAQAFRAAGEPVPRPIRRRGNRRILDTIKRLGVSQGGMIL